MRLVTDLTTGIGDTEIKALNNKLITYLERFSQWLLFQPEKNQPRNFLDSTEQ